MHRAKLPPTAHSDAAEHRGEHALAYTRLGWRGAAPVLRVLRRPDGRSARGPKQSPMAAQTEAMRSIETGGTGSRPRGELGVAELLPSARALGHIVAREL